MGLEELDVSVVTTVTRPVIAVVLTLPLLAIARRSDHHCPTSPVPVASTAPTTNVTRSFRQSFLSAFSVRIGQRLRAVAADTTQDMVVSGADALLPVLAARDESVREKVDAHFPELEHRVVGMTDREGWASGTAAADQALIHAGAGYLGAD